MKQALCKPAMRGLQPFKHHQGLFEPTCRTGTALQVRHIERMWESACTSIYSHICKAFSLCHPSIAGHWGATMLGC